MGNVVELKKRVKLYVEKPPSLHSLTLPEIARKLFILQAFRKELEDLEQLDIED
jgi:hypothetical protein